MKFVKNDLEKSVVIKMSSLEYDSFISKFEEYSSERKFFNAFEKCILPFLDIYSSYIIRKKRN